MGRVTVGGQNVSAPWLGGRREITFNAKHSPYVGKDSGEQVALSFCNEKANANHSDWHGRLNEHHRNAGVYARQFRCYAIT